MQCVELRLREEMVLTAADRCRCAGRVEHFSGALSPWITPAVVLAALDNGKSAIEWERDDAASGAAFYPFRAGAKKHLRNRGERCALRSPRAHAQSGARIAPPRNARSRARARAARARTLRAKQGFRRTGRPTKGGTEPCRERTGGQAGEPRPALPSETAASCRKT